MSASYPREILEKRKQQSIKNATLLFLAFSTAFFSRLVATAGAPSEVNFIHLAIVPAVSAYVVMSSRSKNVKMLRAAQGLLLCLLLFFFVVVASALFSQAGFINIVLSYLLWMEAYIFLCALVYISLSPERLEKIKTWTIKISIFHIGLALLQKVLLDAGIMKATKMKIPPDNVQGVFYLSGGGHVIAASVSIAFAIYCISLPKLSLPLKTGVAIAAIVQLVSADAKQVLLVALVSWGLLILTKVTDLKKALTYAAIAALSLAALLWCMENLDSFRGFNTWVRPEIYGPEGEARLLKYSSIRIIRSYHEDAFSWLFGLGPGHTVGRLGGWMIIKYKSLLTLLGVTDHPVSQEVWRAIDDSWLGGKSSMFSPLFGWAGLWGDLGFAGLFAYFSMLGVIWTTICADDTSKFLLLTIVVNGLIFAQMQEPGYMLYTLLLIGLKFQDKVLASAQYTQRKPIKPQTYPMAEAS